MAQIPKFSEWKLLSLLMGARSNHRCYRNNLLHRWRDLRRDDLFLLEFFWFVHNEGIWKQPCVDEQLENQEGNTRRAATSPLRLSVLTAEPSARRSQGDIERYIKYVHQPVTTYSYLGGLIAFNGPVDFQLELCQFLLNSDSASVQAFAGQFDEPSMNHWEEATKVCVLSIIHHARSHSYRTFCVQQAIARRSYKFLAYLLTKIHDEGENAVANLETEYKALTDGGNLNVNLPDWKAEFEKPLDIWTYDQVWMSDVGSVDWFEE